MPITLRFPIALVLSTACLATPAWADFQSGLEAYNRGDYMTALREFRPLADQGGASAQNNLGVLYGKGQGVPQDYAQARHWWEKAAAQGDVKAQHNLGILYDKGYGVPQDLVQAYKWYNLAGANGYNRGVELRDAVAKQMTPAKIAKAQRLAREWKPKTP